MARGLLFLTLLVLCCTGFCRKHRDHTKISSRTRMLRTNQIEVPEKTKHSRTRSHERCDLSGTWYNQHGSEMFIRNSTYGGVISGEYRTGVETTHGAAGNTYSRIRGTVEGRLFTFHVFWKGGESVTTWTGQCQPACDGAEGQLRLQTSWILTSRTNTCSDHWLANKFGQDVFTRHPSVPGPRRASQTHVPLKRS